MFVKPEEIKNETTPTKEKRGTSRTKPLQSYMEVVVNKSNNLSKNLRTVFNEHKTEKSRCK